MKESIKTLIPGIILAVVLVILLFVSHWNTTRPRHDGLTPPQSAPQKALQTF